MKVKQIYHPYWEWECFHAGMYESKNKFGFDETKCKNMYKDFLSDLNLFEKSINGIFNNWIKSCENFLTWENINRIAWIGQASACYTIGLPSVYKGGFWLLSETQQKNANKLAERYLINWINENDKENKRLY